MTNVQDPNLAAFPSTAGRLARGCPTFPIKRSQAHDHVRKGTPMRVNTPVEVTDPQKNKQPKLSRRRLEYCVPPLLVNDLETQCAAHFLAWFASNSVEHVRDVLRCGVNPAGGMVEEVEHWVQQCESDVSDPAYDLGYWDIATNGPWVYQGLSAVAIAQIVRRHTRGWSPKDFASYGYTSEEKAALDAAILSFGQAKGPSRTKGGAK
jgi:hypothetical protein